MQQSNELRIGNYIQNADGIRCPVTQLSKIDNEIGISASCQPPGEQFGGMIEVYSAIPLSREILQASGFIRSFNNPLPDAASYSLKGIILNSEFRLCTYYGGLTIVGNRLLFVHQLQNLYNVLTGDELTIVFP